MMPMTPFNPIFALVVLLVSTATGWAIARCFNITQSGNRVSTVDGLRGYLALGVFCHHGAIWYQFLHNPTKGWALTPSAFYNEIGGTGVSLFFMVTGFLFFRKILDADIRPIDWHRLYASRILRLTPLYLFVISVMLLVVGFETHFERHESILRIAREALGWIFFSYTMPNINGLPNTFFIVAGATWTLIWEWRFYFALPIIAWAMRTPPQATRNRFSKHYFYCLLRILSKLSTPFPGWNGCCNPVASSLGD